MVSQHLVLELTVKLSDLKALLSGAELGQLRRPGADQRLLFGVGVTDDAGNLLGNGSAYPKAASLSVTGLTSDQITAVAKGL